MFIIAEIGLAHEGSLGIAHSYIDALATTGVNAVKFQTHIADAESSIHEPFRIKFSYEDSSRIEYWKRTGFSLNQWKDLKKHCDDVGVEFMSSPFSQEAVDWLEEIGVQRHKIASGEVTNLLMLEKIGRTGKPVILSSGMSSFEELDIAVELLYQHTKDLTILQCTTSYPTPSEMLGLNVIQEIKKRYPDAKTGLSEHTGKIFAGLAAVTLGAEVLEFHAVFDRRMFGPDANSSLEIDEIKQMVEGINFINNSLKNPVNKSDNSMYLPLKNIFEKSLGVRSNLSEGHILTFDDLETKKPSGMGIPASQYTRVLGKQLLIAKNQYDYLNQEDINLL